MSGSGTAVLGASTTATGVAVLPNTGSSHTLFVVALGAVIAGVVMLLATGLVALKQRSSKA